MKGSGSRPRTSASSQVRLVYCGLPTGITNHASLYSVSAAQCRLQSLRGLATGAISPNKQRGSTRQAAPLTSALSSFIARSIASIVICILRNISRRSCAPPRSVGTAKFLTSWRRCSTVTARNTCKASTASFMPTTARSIPHRRLPSR